MEAAIDLFGQHGLGGVTVADIAAAAGTSVGSFYHHFRDKEAALAAAYEMMAAEMEATGEAALDPGRWEGATIRDILEAYLEFNLANGHEQPGQKRLMNEAARLDPSLRDSLAKLRRKAEEGLAALFRARWSEIGHPDPDQAISFAIDQVNSMLTIRLDSGYVASRFDRQDDEQFVAETIRSIAGYLQLTDQSDG